MRPANEISTSIAARIRATRSRRTPLGADGRADHAPEQCLPFINETQFYKSLHFAPLEAQSRMSKREPDRLVLDYTRTMMAFLLFNDAPRQIAMIGLGGGSLAKFCHRELPGTCIDVVEINPHVVALRDAFKVPADDDRFRVHLDDGAQYIRRSPGCFDVLLVDAYVREGIPAHMACGDFYECCRDSLRADGIMVLNLYCTDADSHLRRIRQSFGAAVVVIDEADGTNRVVIACRSADGLQQPARRCPAHFRPVAWSSLQCAFLRARTALRNWRSQHVGTHVASHGPRRSIPR